MFRAFNLSSKYGRSKAEKILLTYQTFAISVKVPTPYTTQPPCHNCVAILGEIEGTKNASNKVRRQTYNFVISRTYISSPFKDLNTVI